MKITLLFSAILFFIGKAVADLEESVCPVWNCQTGLGNDLVGEERMCAQRSGVRTYAEECQPNDHLCEVGPLMTGHQNCSAVSALPWKKDMAAGEDCNGNATCFDQVSCNNVDGKRRCVGLDEGARCTNDKQCEPGLFCHHTGSGASRKCEPVKNITEQCDQHTRCTFGSACVNSTCTEFANFTDGTRFEYMDEELLPNPVTEGHPDVQVFRVCENFWAIDTGFRSADKKRTIYECSGGPERTFNNDERDENNVNCLFELTAPNGTVIESNETAVCGFNNHNRFVCPARRGPKQFKNENSRARATWRELRDDRCHHRSTIQYCPTIQDNVIIQHAFLDALRTEHITQKDNWSMIQKNDRCVGNAITQTRNYWRLIDSAYGFMGSIAVIGGIMFSLIY